MAQQPRSKLRAEQLPGLFAVFCRLAAEPAVLRRRQMMILPEDLSKIAAGAKAGFNGNFQNAFLRIHKKRLRILNPQRKNVFDWGNAKMVLKQPVTFPLADRNAGGD